MDHQVLLFCLNAELMKAFAWIRPVWGISQAILIAQVFFYLSVNLLDCLLAGNFKQPSAGFARHLFQYLLSIHALFLRIAVTTTT